MKKFKAMMACALALLLCLPGCAGASKPKQAAADSAEEALVNFLTNLQNGEQILFRYWADGFGDSLPEKLEKAVQSLVPENTFVNGREAQLYADVDGVNHLVWHSEEDAYWISARLAGGELIKIAESVGQLSNPQQ